MSEQLLREAREELARYAQNKWPWMQASDLISRIDAHLSAAAPKAEGPWKVGNEFLPYHPDASHVLPDYRDGWNACYELAQDELAFVRQERDLLDGQVADLKSGAAAREAPAGWRPIETAPRDGTKVLLWGQGYEFAPIGHWRDQPDDDGGYFYGWGLESDATPRCCVAEGFIGWQEDVEDGHMPTHWMPLPAPPAAEPHHKEGDK